MRSLRIRKTKARSATITRMPVNVFVFRCLVRIISLFSISEISSLHLASITLQAGLCLTLSKIRNEFFRVAASS